MSDAATVKLLSSDEIAKQIKPLSKNGFLAFFQKIGRGWLTFWYGFSDKHPKLAKILYMLFFFILFSQAVTIFQFLIFNFGPILLKGTSLAGNNWGLPLIPMGEHNVTGETVYFRILGAAPRYDADGLLITGAGAGGMAYFIMFMIGTFLAQCINFPLQRNITFRSHGNPVYQAMWYLIGWIFIQPITMAIGSAWEGLRDIYLGAWPGFVTTLLNTVIMGGVAMAIFFVVFLIIFPDYNKVAKSKRAKLEKVKQRGEDGLIIEKAEEAAADAEMKAKLSNAEKAQAKTTTQASARAMAYFASVKNAEKVKGTDKEKEAQERIAARQKAASEAVVTREEAIKAYKAAVAESKAPKVA